MADGLVNMADQFKGLPMEALIGGPLEAAVKANLMMAKSTSEFINSVGFDQIVKDGQLVPGKARTSYFEFERPGVDANGERTIEQVKVQVPMLAIVPIPNLQIDTVDVVFDMEVKSSTSEKTSKDTSGKFSGDAKIGWGPFSAKVSISGSTSSHQENTRSSDNSAKYHVEVHAKNYGIPEGLARVLDMMAEAAKPLDVKAYKPNADGLLDVDPTTGKPDPSKGVPVKPNAEPVEVPA